MFGKAISRLAVPYSVLLVCLILAPLCAASNHWSSWDYEESRNDTRDFVSGGLIRVHLSVGDVHIRRGGSNQIRAHYTVKSGSENHVKDARLDIDIHGNTADLDFHAPGHNTQIDVELEVPQNSNLDVHEKVGDLTIDDIEGDKDLDLGVGDIRIAGDDSSYRFVHASTSIGDVNGSVHGSGREEVSGWLGKTLKYHGEGKYELHAHVSVGDITLGSK
jgi:hypothetical protein